MLNTKALSELLTKNVHQKLCPSLLCAASLPNALSSP